MQQTSASLLCYRGNWPFVGRDRDAHVVRSCSADPQELSLLHALLRSRRQQAQVSNWRRSLASGGTCPTVNTASRQDTLDSAQFPKQAFGEASHHAATKWSKQIRRVQQVAWRTGQPNGQTEGLGPGRFPS